MVGRSSAATRRTRSPAPPQVDDERFTLFGYVDASGQCVPFGEMEDIGGSNQFQRLNNPTGSVSVDETGKIRVSGMVNQ